ncbi:MAG: hypothetical protein J6Y58_07795 [Clostridiales bacterium]|nr:hypothetical protein [Clostridiales bacterium]
MRKALGYIYLLAFLLILLIPLFLVNTKRYSVSEIDNRTLALPPEIGDKDFPQTFETYLKDRIGFRTEMINLYTVFNDTFMGDLTHPGYMNGKNGYIFRNMHYNIKYGEYHRAFADFVAMMKDYCEARGVDFYFEFEPEKTSVLRQYLPDGVNYDDSWVDQLIAEIEARGVKCADNKALLSEKSKTEQVFNVKYDAGHWNDLGCFYSTNNVLSLVHQDHPEVTELRMDDYDIGTKVEKYMPTSRFVLNEEVPVFTLKQNGENLTEKYQEGLSLSPEYQHFHYLVNPGEEAQKLPRFLVFQGSYYNGRPQFYLARSSEYIGIHNYQNVFQLDEYINAFDPDVVVFEVAEYTLMEKYFSLSSLKEPHWNTPLVDLRKEESSDAQLNAILASAIRSEKRDLCVLEYDGLKRVYVFNDGMRATKYAYLLAGEKIFDLTEDEDGLCGTLIPSDADLSGAKLLFETYDGERYLADVAIRRSVFLQDVFGVNSSNAVKIQDASKYYSEFGTLSNVCEITTDLKDNEFDRLQIQLLNMELTSSTVILNTNVVGEYSDSFCLNGPTGWYRIRVKANSNLQDEYMDHFVFLESGAEYVYALKLHELSKDLLIFSDFTVFGPSSAENRVQDVAVDPTPSEGAVIREDGSYAFETKTEGNRFSSIVLLGESSTDPSGWINIGRGSSAGTYHGYYCHKDATGPCRFLLKGNSNLKDEYVSFTCDVKKYALYEYTFEIVELEDKKIEVKDFRFEQIAEVKKGKNSVDN